MLKSLTDAGLSPVIDGDGVLSPKQPVSPPAPPTASTAGESKAVQPPPLPPPSTRASGSDSPSPGSSPERGASAQHHRRLRSFGSAVLSSLRMRELAAAHTTVRGAQVEEGRQGSTRGIVAADTVGTDGENIGPGSDLAGDRPDDTEAGAGAGAGGGSSTDDAGGNKNSATEGTDNDKKAVPVIAPLRGNGIAQSGQVPFATPPRRNLGDGLALSMIGHSLSSGSGRSVRKSDSTKQDDLLLGLIQSQRVALRVCVPTSCWFGVLVRCLTVRVGLPGHQHEPYGDKRIHGDAHGAA